MRERIKKHPRVVGVCALVLVIAAVVLWHTRPISFAGLTPGLDRDDIQSAGATYTKSFNDAGTPRSIAGDLDLDGDDPLIGELFELFSSHTYRRRLSNLFGRKSVSGHINWSLVFAGNCEMLMFDTDSGLYLSYSAADGSSASLRCSVSDYEQLRQDVFELLRSSDPDAGE
ncbi:MAG: hypothetical protein NC319_04275 [Butyricicoccus sp.]|nr:hypothetical protein [Butyricicoccus sp.]